jgi:cytochrome c553
VFGALALMVTATACNASRSETLGSGSAFDESEWAGRQGFAGNAQAVAGARIFARAGCLTCHTYLGEGTSNLGAPDLTAIGRASNRSAAGFAAYVANPAKFGDEVMPRFARLGRANVRNLGAFLAASKGAQ